MNNDLISRKALLARFEELRNHPANRLQDIVFLDGAMSVIDNAPAVVITGETSDGYHTFNELYHHRAVLFSVIVKAFPEKAWKARKHHDGSMFDGMFIVGIETPSGQATYHYDINPYWDMFRCKEVEFAPEWDGHTADQAIERIGKLESVRHGEWKPLYFDSFCSVCGYVNKAELVTRMRSDPRVCPNCGAKMDGENECSKG